ncbi:MAG: hypothetical protein K2X55_25205, partial [Burkholderiaceae bacterium]|nr:hypothetical protein [Burkholderiaceae bacterium]
AVEMWRAVVKRPETKKPLRFSILSRFGKTFPLGAWQAGRRSPIARHQTWGGHATRCSEPRYRRGAEHRSSCVAGPRAERGIHIYCAKPHGYYISFLFEIENTTTLTRRVKRIENFYW